MKLYPEQLGAQLQKTMAPAYLISGDEPLLVQEACDQIRAAAKAAGFEERLVFQVESSFNWHEVLEAANTMSLFASRRVLEIRLSGKPADKGAALKTLLEKPNPDNLLLIISPRLDSASSKTAWVKLAEQQGVFVPIWPLERSRYPNWLKQRAQQAGLQFEPTALSLLAQQTEGNLLAATQEIEKLRLFGDRIISATVLQNAISDSSRFDAFNLCDAALLGNLPEATRILASLQAEGLEPIMILGALLRKIHQLVSLKSIPRTELAQAFKSQGIWDKQQPPYQHALAHLNLRQLEAALLLAAKVDSAVKGSGENPWRLLEELVVLLSGANIFQH